MFLREVVQSDGERAIVECLMRERIELERGRRRDRSGTGRLVEVTESDGQLDDRARSCEVRPEADLLEAELDRERKRSARQCGQRLVEAAGGKKRETHIPNGVSGSARAARVADDCG